MKGRPPPRDPFEAKLAAARALLAEGRNEEACELIVRVMDARALAGRGLRFQRLQDRLGSVGAPEDIDVGRIT